MGTGSTLALLPAQNATGNFVKVVQRLPVRIDLVNYDPDKIPLFVGLSVEPTVDLDSTPTGPNAGKFLQESTDSTPPAHVRRRNERGGHAWPCPAPRRGGAAAHDQSMDRRAGGGDPDLHGGAGHHHRECGAALHRRRPFRAGDGQRVGHHQLPRGQCDHPADLRLARRQARAGAIIFCSRSRVFTLASALCGMATSLGMLIASRVLQGFAGGGLQPSSQGVLLDTFPPEKQGAAMTMFSVAALLAPVVGPTLGGFITDNYGWRWIFYLNLPVGLGALIFCRAVVFDPALPQGRAGRARASRRRPLRYAGLCLLGVTMVCWEVMLSKGQEWDWLGDPFFRVQTLLVLFLVCGAGLVWREMRIRNPLINFRTLRDRNFRTCCLIIFCAFGVLYANTTTLPALLQSLFGYDATTSGLVLSPAGHFRRDHAADHRAAARARRGCAVAHGLRIVHPGPRQLLDVAA